MQKFAKIDEGETASSGKNGPTLMAVILASVVGTFGGIAVAFLAMGYFYGGDISALKGNDTASAAISEQSSSETAAIASGNTANASDHADAYLWTARVRLEDLALNETLKVTLTEDGKILVQGALLDRQAGRYELFKDWFSSRSNYPKLIDEVNIIKTSGLMPKIKSVWLGDEPSVHLESGDDLKVGNMIGDGWKVMEIGRLSMKLERRGTVIDIAYNDS